jgi:antitoxin (DNA-binding transcriptional repressor) of toxin-antitoxin stability system
MSNKIAMSHFKAHCLELIDNLQKNNETIIITKRNQAVATVTPINTSKKTLFGSLKDKAVICSNIVDSLEQNWDAEHE